MKVLFNIILSILSLNLGATVYYVDISGGNNANTGLYTFDAWQTLDYAAANAYSVGDTIYLLPGLYTLNAGISISEGVSLYSADKSLVTVESNLLNDWAFAINLYSSSEGTDGNQSISGITFNGNYNGSTGTWGMILITGRSNVVIHDCEFYDVRVMGVTYAGKIPLYNPTVLPVTRATGNKFYNNYMENCSGFIEGSHADGSLQYGSQKGIEIYDNVIVCTTRVLGSNGYPIKYFNGGFSQGEQIYNNYLYKEDPNNVSSLHWNFAIELWGWNGGTHIYNNHIRGGIDIGSGDTTHIFIDEGYDYLADIHDNFFGYSEPINNVVSSHSSAIFIERTAPRILFHNNYIKHIHIPIYYTVVDQDNAVFEDHYFYYNIFDSIGTAAGAPDAPASLNYCATLYQSDTCYFRNINIFNNYIIGGMNTGVGVRIPDYAIIQSFEVSNNVITGFNYYPLTTSHTSYERIDSLRVENNIFYGNGTNTVTHYGNSPIYESVINNLTVSPGFAANDSLYLMPVGSQMIDNGKDLGFSFVTEDYSGVNVPFNSIFDIGAREYYEEQQEEAQPAQQIQQNTGAPLHNNGIYIRDNNGKIITL